MWWEIEVFKTIACTLLHFSSLSDILCTPLYSLLAGNSTT